jgi:hypothetical protein
MNLSTAGRWILEEMPTFFSNVSGGKYLFYVYGAPIQPLFHSLFVLLLELWKYHSLYVKMGVPRDYCGTLKDLKLQQLCQSITNFST